MDSRSVDENGALTGKELSAEEKIKLTKIFAVPGYFKRGPGSPFDRDRLNGEGSSVRRDYTETDGEKILQYMQTHGLKDAMKDLFFNILCSGDGEAELHLETLLKAMNAQGVDLKQLRLDPFAVFYRKGSQEWHSMWECNTSVIERVSRLYPLLSDILPPTAPMLYAMSEVSRISKDNAKNMDELNKKISGLPAAGRLSSFMRSMDDVFATPSFLSLLNYDRSDRRKTVLESRQSDLGSMAVLAVQENDEAAFEKIINQIVAICERGIKAPPSLLQNILEISQPQDRVRVNLEPFIKALFKKTYKFHGQERPLVQFDFEKDSRPLQTCVALDTKKTDSTAVVGLCIENMKPITRWSPDFAEILKTRLTGWASIPALQPMLDRVLKNCPRNKIKKGEMGALLISSQTLSPFTFDILRLHDNVGMAAKYLRESVGTDTAKSLDLKSATIDQLKSVFEETLDGCTRAPYMKSHQHVQDWLSVIAHHASHKASSSSESVSRYKPLLQSILIGCYKPGIFTRTFGMESRYKKILAHIEDLEKHYRENKDSQVLAVLYSAKITVKEKLKEMGCQVEEETTVSHSSVASQGGSGLYGGALRTSSMDSRTQRLHSSSSGKHD